MYAPSNLCMEKFPGPLVSNNYFNFALRKIRTTKLVSLWGIESNKIDQIHEEIEKNS